tara:strand:- start:3100 stop:3546 length:447 start_codon:yes stop_codon:yes gene_type:complete
MSGVVGGAGSKSGVIGKTEIDVENGTWTPAPNSGSFSSFSAEYSRIGRIVQIRCYCNCASSFNMSWFTGLPFTVATGQHTFFAIGYEYGSHSGSNFNNDNCTGWAYATGASDKITTGSWGWNTGWGGHVVCASNTVFMCSGVYSTDEP